MKKTVSRVLVLIVAIAICVGITACKNDPEFTYESKEPKANMYISAISPKEGENIVLLNDEMAEFMETYTKGAGDKFFVGTDEDHFAPKVVTLSWEYNKAEKPEYFVVEYATNIRFENSLKIVTFESSADVTNLYANSKYYWQVSAFFEDNVVKSSIFTFNTADTVRTVTIDGVQNSRDIGGIMTESGKRLKQGMVYRSAIIAGKVTDIGRDQAIRELGIKSELDLTTNTPGKSQLGDRVNYIPVSGYYYGNFINSANWNNLANEFRVFADPDNYPILFHCAIGRDRTGCLAATLEALCGVPEELIYRDYETSFFSGACTGEQTKNGNFPSQLMIPQLDVVMKTIKNYGAIAESDNPSLAECTEIFLKVGLKLTQKEIDTIREMMIED